MRRDVLTLYVVGGKGGHTAVLDTIAALRWTSRGTYHILLVDVVGDAYSDNNRWRIDDAPDLTVRRTPLPPEVPIGSAWGLGRALAQIIVDQEIGFSQAILMSDEILITGKGLDGFGLDALAQSKASLIGAEVFCSRAHYRASIPDLERLSIPNDAWEHPPCGVGDGLLVLAEDAVRFLYGRNLLAPKERMPNNPSLPYGVYLAWTLRLLGRDVLLWGSCEQPLPPLYLGDAGDPMPPPMFLVPQFLAFGPVRGVLTYAESELRAIYRHLRGEGPDPSSRYGPVLAPAEDEGD